MLFKQAAYYGDFRQTSMNSTINLLAIAVGIKQKDLVNEMVKKVCNLTRMSNYSCPLLPCG